MTRRSIIADGRGIRGCEERFGMKMEFMDICREIRSNLMSEHLGLNKTITMETIKFDSFQYKYKFLIIKKKTSDTSCLNSYHY